MESATTGDVMESYFMALGTAWKCLPVVSVFGPWLCCRVPLNSLAF